MHELMKFIGGVGWVVGFVLLAVDSSLGLITLVVAALVTIWSVQKTRERRHQELLDATRASKQ